MRKTVVSLLAALLLTATPLSAQTTNTEIKQALTNTIEQLQALKDRIPADPPPVTVVNPGGDLQAALALGGTIELRTGATYTSAGFVVVRPGTVLRGNVAALVGTAGPALYNPPGIHDGAFSDLTATSAAAGSVIQCGDNGPTQTTLAQVPQRITFTRVTIPTHRGKRGFELNCSATLTESTALDVWSPALQDSQAIWVGNTCGPVTVTGGEYVAASENVLIGGDVLKITDCPGGEPSGLTFRNVRLTKPEAWRTDGVKRAVKNLFEVKRGRAVVLAESFLSGSWGPTFGGAQDGSAIVITPKNGGYIEGVLIDKVTVERAASGVQLMGKDYNSVTPQATTGVVIRNSRFAVSKTFGGRGILALSVGGMLDSTWENVDFTGDGNAIVVSDTTTPQGPFTVRNSRLTSGTYGIVANGANYGNVPGATYAGRELLATLEGNSVDLAAMSASGRTLFKANFPSNTYVP